MSLCRDETETASPKSWRQAASTASLRLLFIFGGWLFDAGVALMALSFDEHWEKTRRSHATWHQKQQAKSTKAAFYDIN
jgi:hypothetical protein